MICRLNFFLVLHCVKFFRSANATNNKKKTIAFFRKYAIYEYILHYYFRTYAVCRVSEIVELKFQLQKSAAEHSFWCRMSTTFVCVQSITR